MKGEECKRCNGSGFVYDSECCDAGDCSKRCPVCTTDDRVESSQADKTTESVEGVGFDPFMLTIPECGWVNNVNVSDAEFGRRVRERIRRDAWPTDTQRTNQSGGCQ